MNQEGYRNLCRLVTLSYKEGFYYKPRIDKELLREFNGGLIALSGCLASEVNQAIAIGSIDRARAVMEEYRAMFDGRYYVEIQDNHLPQQEKANVELVRLANELGLPLVATNDCHYLETGGCQGARGAALHPDRQDLQRREALALRDRPALREGSGRNARRVRRTVPRRSANTLDVASRCDLELTFGKYQFPVFATPNARDASKTHLDRVARDGLERAPRRAARAGRVDRRARAPVSRSPRGGAEDHQGNGLRRLLPHRRRLHQLREAPRHPGRARAAARRPAAWWPTRSASPTSIRCRTICSSSASSTRSASRCPISTWTSASSGATR